MKTIEFLDESGAKYEITEHKPAFSAQRMAAEEHEPGRYVAKPVLVKADDKFILCILSACNKIDLGALKAQLGAKSVELATEDDIAEIFTDCELGAEPPFGNLYGLDTVMDKYLEKGGHIIFQAGSHDKAVRMSVEDYRKLAEAKVLEFSYQMA